MDCPECEAPIPDDLVTSAAASIIGKRSKTHSGRPPQRFEHLGRSQTIREWCKELGINRHQFMRVRKQSSSTE